MKTHVLVGAVLALACACSSSASERPSTNDERQAAIERDRNELDDSSDGMERDDGEHRDGIAGDDREHARAERAEARSDARSEANEELAEGRDDVTEREPDNTGRNERDDEPGNLTALDQSNRTSDVDITQAIRKKVVADDALSFNAKNVKIITVSGKVTLRGPVESAQESSAIEKSARAVPGVVQVDNQIEVKR